MINVTLNNGTVSSYFSPAIKKTTKSLKINTTITNGTNMAKIVPTDFSYKYFTPSLPSDSFLFALFGNTIIAIALVGISDRLTILTAILKAPDAAGEIMFPNIH